MCFSIWLSVTLCTRGIICGEFDAGGFNDFLNDVLLHNDFAGFVMMNTCHTACDLYPRCGGATNDRRRFRVPSGGGGRLVQDGTWRRSPFPRKVEARSNRPNKPHAFTSLPGDASRAPSAPITLAT